MSFKHSLSVALLKTRRNTDCAYGAAQVRPFFIREADVLLRFLVMWKNLNVSYYCFRHRDFVPLHQALFRFSCYLRGVLPCVDASRTVPPQFSISEKRAAKNPERTVMRSAVTITLRNVDVRITGGTVITLQSQHFKNRGLEMQ